VLGTQGLWAERYFYHATSAVTWGLGFSGLIRRITAFRRLLMTYKGSGGSILTRIHTSLDNLKNQLFKNQQWQSKYPTTGYW
jgi:hypothetical protein